MDMQPAAPAPPSGIPEPEVPKRNEAPPAESPRKPQPENAPTDSDTATRVDVTA